MIERIIASTATCDGRRIRLRFLGASKTTPGFRQPVRAINLRTLIDAGLARRRGTWALA